jgi:two-component system KDP operon response regulator KdpE
MQAANKLYSVFEKAIMNLVMSVYSYQNSPPLRTTIAVGAKQSVHHEIVQDVVINMALAPKILLISDLQATSPFWAFNAIQQHWDITLESHPEKAAQRCAELLPDLIICDIKEDSQSIELIPQLREQTIWPILLLTSNSSEKFMLEAYAAGAEECIRKPIPSQLLEAKIKAWLRHSSVTPVGVLESLKVDELQLLPADRALVLDDKEPIHLTNLEIRLLYYLMGHPGRTVPTQELCHHIWGLSTDVDAMTLKNLVYRLRQKIEEDPSRPRYIHTVVGVGYQFCPS